MFGVSNRVVRDLEGRVLQLQNDLNTLNTVVNTIVGHLNGASTKAEEQKVELYDWGTVAYGADKERR